MSRCLLDCVLQISLSLFVCQRLVEGGRDCESVLVTDNVHLLRHSNSLLEEGDVVSFPLLLSSSLPDSDQKNQKKSLANERKKRSRKRGGGRVREMFVFGEKRG